MQYNHNENTIKHSNNFELNSEHSNDSPVKNSSEPGENKWIKMELKDNNDGKYPILRKGKGKEAKYKCLAGECNGNNQEIKRDALKKHFTAHHSVKIDLLKQTASPTEMEKFICEKCGKEMTRKQTFAEHKRRECTNKGRIKYLHFF